MNTGIERRPFKVLRPLKHSTAMVIARYATRGPAIITGTNPVAPKVDVLWKALLVGSLCAACAFAFFVLSERHLFQQSGQALGPVPDSIQRIQLTRKGRPSAEAVADGKAILAENQAPKFDLPADTSLKVTEFSLPVSAEFQQLDGIQLKLAGVNDQAHTYDMAIRTRYREFYRQGVKVQEHLAVSKDQRPGPEIVVAGIAHNQVYGYLTEPQTFTERSRPHRHHHRRR